jgi:MFS family permease
MKEVLKNKIYVSVMIADIISNFGDVLYYLALLNYVVQIKESELAIALVSVSETLPILLAFVLGFFADRSKNRIKSIISTLLIRMGLYCIVALVIGFDPSLWVVLVISFINCVSDILGQYENSLYYPISNRLVRKEIRENVMAFRQSLGMSLNALFQAIGGVLIIYVSYRNLAVINALTFATSFIIISIIKPQLKNYCAPVSEEIEDNRQKLGELPRDIMIELRDSIKMLWNIDEIKETLLSIPILNGGMAIITALAVLQLTKDNSFVVVTTEITISVIAASATCGRIVGSFLTMNALKKISLIKALLFSFLSMIIIFFGMIVGNIFIVIFALFAANVWTGCIDPKMGAMIFNNINENKLATTFGGIVTYFQLGDIASRLIFSGMVLLFSVKTISEIYIVASMIAIVILASKRH